MRRPMAIICLLFAVSVAHCEAPLLSRLMVRASGPVEVTVPLEGEPQSPVYRAADGTFRPLEVSFAAGRARFSLPPDAVGSTVVILRAPEWLVFSDATPPVVTAIAVDGRAMQAAAQIDLGHYTTAPESMEITFADEHSPVDAGAAVVTLDGSAFPEAGLIWTPADEAPRTRTLQIRTGEVTEGRHTLKVRVPDAAPAPNFSEIQFLFASGPLVKDGGFEMVKADGTPQFWTVNAWSADAETKAELKVVEGGRSGDYCGELNGIAGPLNLLFGQQLPLSPDRTYRVSLFARATGGGGHVSMINASQDDNKQYLNSPRIPVSEDWRPFEWEFTTKPSSGYTLYLRNASTGAVQFDDVVVEEVRQE